MIKAVIFDFGGVLAEKGFREGLKAIGIQNGLDPDSFFQTASDLVYQTGYVTGISDEAYFWNTLREITGIKMNDKDLRKEIMDRFILKPDMIAYAEKLKSSGLITAILSDQTNWLEEVNYGTPRQARLPARFAESRRAGRPVVPFITRLCPDQCQDFGEVIRQVTSRSPRRSLWRSPLGEAEGSRAEALCSHFILRSRNPASTEDGHPRVNPWFSAKADKTPFYHHFNYIFNSFRLNKSKKDPSLFSDTCRAIGLASDEALFIDDNIENIRRAQSRSLHTIHFKDIKGFETALRKFIN